MPKSEDVQNGHSAKPTIQSGHTPNHCALRRNPHRDDFVHNSTTQVFFGADSRRKGNRSTSEHRVRGDDSNYVRSRQEPDTSSEQINIQMFFVFFKVMHEEAKVTRNNVNQSKWIFCDHQYNRLNELLFIFTGIQGYLFASDIKMCIRICLGEVPVIQNEQYTTATSLIKNNQ